MSATVDVAVSWPPLASSRSNSTSVPLWTVSIGGIAGSQARWNRSRAMWIAEPAAIGAASSSTTAL